MQQDMCPQQCFHIIRILSPYEVIADQSKNRIPRNRSLQEINVLTVIGQVLVNEGSVFPSVLVCADKVKSAQYVCVVFSCLLCMNAFSFCATNFKKYAP